MLFISCLDPHWLTSMSIQYGTPSAHTLFNMVLSQHTHFFQVGTLLLNYSQRPPSIFLGQDLAKLLRLVLNPPSIALADIEHIIFLTQPPE